MVIGPPPRLILAPGLRPLRLSSLPFRSDRARQFQGPPVAHDLMGRAREVMKDYLPILVGHSVPRSWRDCPAIECGNVLAGTADALDGAHLQERAASLRDEPARPSPCRPETISDHELSGWAILCREIGEQRQSVEVGDQGRIERRLDNVLHHLLSAAAILPDAVRGFDDFGVW
jgi:hypothetical protein